MPLNNTNSSKICFKFFDISVFILLLDDCFSVLRRETTLAILAIAAIRSCSLSRNGQPSTLLNNCNRVCQCCWRDRCCAQSFLPVLESFKEKQGFHLNNQPKPHLPGLRPSHLISSFTRSFCSKWANASASLRFSQSDCKILPRTFRCGPSHGRVPCIFLSQLLSSRLCPLSKSSSRVSRCQSPPSNYLAISLGLQVNLKCSPPFIAQLLITTSSSYCGVGSHGLSIPSPAAVQRRHASCLSSNDRQT